MLPWPAPGAPIDPLDHARTLLARGQAGQAERLARRVLALRPDDVGATEILAEVCVRRGDVAGALRAWMQAARLAPTDPAPLEGLGRLLARAGKIAEAKGAFAEAARRAPRDPALRGRLADAALQLGDTDAALQHLQHLAALSPADPVPLRQAAAILQAERDLSGAAAHLTLALRRDPACATTWLSLALLRSRLHDPDGALEAVAQAQGLAADAPEPPEIGGRVALRAGRMGDARAWFDDALARAPNRPGALWGRTAAVPVIAASETHEREIIATYARDLEETSRSWSAGDDPTPWLDAAQTAFPRHYHGGDCMAEQRMHGDLLAGVIGAVAPPARARPAPAAGQRIRVAFASSYLYQHTVTKLFRGWMQDLDRDRFTVLGVSLNHRNDDTTAALEGAFDGWVDARGSLQRSISQLRSAEADVVIFPELGMDPGTLRLAAARHAPTQLVAWGHPVTPGLPTIDGFLSSAAMAVSPDRRWTRAPRHDLPGLSIHYTRPAPPPAGADRAAFGLPPDRPLALCVQTVAKFRPWTDGVHAALAAAAPDAVLVFVEDYRPDVTEAFRARLGRSFDAHGLDLDAHVRFVPRMSEAAWMQLMSLGDLFLDGLGWSGGNTSLEALSVGLPCLAFPGETMRGRHTLGMVRELGLPALAADDAPDFVARAAALLGDAAARARLRGAILERVDALYTDTRGVRALEQLLIERVERLRRGG